MEKLAEVTHSNRQCCVMFFFMDLCKVSALPVVDKFTCSVISIQTELMPVCHVVTILR